MTHVLIRHKVSSYEDWKKVFDNFADTRKASGELTYHVLQKDEDKDNLYVMFEWDGEDKARAFLKSPELKEAMQKAGVAEAPEIHFLNEADKGSL
jgi:quinol monooxygenase YgiN